MRPARTLSIAVVVLALAMSLWAAPTAATPDDGLLGGDSSAGDGLIGGDSGIDAGSDGVSIAGDDGVSVGTDGVSVGGDGGVNVSTDGVTVAGQEAGTDAVGGLGETDSLAPSGTTDGLLDVPNVSDGLPGGPGIGDGAPGVGTLIGPDGVVDTEDSDVNLSRVDVLGPLPNTDGEQVEDTLSGSTEDVPVGSALEPVETLPTEQAPGPQALPVGSDSQIGCSKPVTAGDLPLEAVPYIDDLPVQPPTVPLLPTRVASPENLAGLGFSFAPDTCEIYDPDNPSIDPTDPPTNPTGEYRTADFSVTDERASYYGLSEGELEEGGPGWDGLFIFLLTEERAASVNELTVTDGQTDNYAGVETDMRAQRDLEQSQADFTVYLPGAGGLNTGLECGNVPEHEVDPLEEPTATCEIDQPIPEVVTPEKVVNVIKNPPEYDLPNIEGDQLPIDV